MVFGLKDGSKNVLTAAICSVHVPPTLDTEVAKKTESGKDKKTLVEYRADIRRIPRVHVHVTAMKASSSPHSLFFWHIFQLSVEFLDRKDPVYLPASVLQDFIAIG